ncbi:MAG TPA: tautomerase family protein [Phototrophicaceae bacterium]|nr:tautomerase family protein [Phototrophicaceae bacterium]
MPVIDVTYPSGSLNQETQATIATQLTDIVMEIEGTKGIAAIAAGTWLLLHEANPNTVAVGGKFAPGRYRVEIATPEGTLNMAQKAELIRRVTDTILQIEGTTPDDTQRARVYCLLREIPDGGWGFSGLAITKEFTATRLRALKEGQA